MNSNMALGALMNAHRRAQATKPIWAMSRAEIDEELSCYVDEAGHDREHWMESFTGGRLNPLTLTDGELRFTDIVRGLANQPRFAGQSEFLSVAQHSYNTAYYAYGVTGSREVAFAALMHDADECILGDLARPVKYLSFMRPYRLLCARVLKVIWAQYGISESLMELVKPMDEVMLATEAHQLRMNTKTWELKAEPLPGYKLLPLWTPGEAINHFRSAFLAFDSAQDAMTSEVGKVEVPR